ncbi:hypothetical protein [Streptomyces sp. NPDC002692]
MESSSFSPWSRSLSWRPGRARPAPGRLPARESSSAGVGPAASRTGGASAAAEPTAGRPVFVDGERAGGADVERPAPVDGERPDPVDGAWSDPVDGRCGRDTDGRCDDDADGRCDGWAAGPCDGEAGGRWDGGSAGAWSVTADGRRDGDADGRREGDTEAEAAGEARGEVAGGADGGAEEAAAYEAPQDGDARAVARSSSNIGPRGRLSHGVTPVTPSRSRSPMINGASLT